MQPSNNTVAAIKTGIFFLCLIPLARLVLGAAEHSLGANPIEFIMRSLGTWALNFLLITLLVTPLRRITGWNWLLRLRRMFGLYVFFYALLHLTTYLWLDQDFEWGEILKDIIKRPFITAGMFTVLLMLPLAITSSNSMIRRLGGKRWQNLHRLIYVFSITAVLHYWWLVKKDTTLPMIYAVMLAVLLGLRVLYWVKERRAKA